MSKSLVYAAVWALLGWSFLFTPVSAWTQPTSGVDQTGQALQPVRDSSSLDGTWQFNVERPDRRMHWLVELRQRQDRTIDGTVLSPTDGESGVLSGRQTEEGRFTLSVTLGGRLREFAFQAQGEALTGHYLSRGASYPFSGARIKLPKMSVSHKSFFSAIWSATDRYFYDPEFRGVDWKAARDRYLPRAEKAQTPGEFVRVIRAMLSELKASHLDFYFEPEEVFQKRNAEAITWKTLSPQVGYLQIRTLDCNNDEEAARFYASLDKAIAELRQYPAIVLDVRGNLGGAFNLMVRATDRFLATPTPVLHISTREGLRNLHAHSLSEVKLSDFPVIPSTEDWPEGAVARLGAGTVYAGGRATPSYPGRIAVLVDNNCASACELLTAVLKEKRDATVVGERTRGVVLGSREIPFSKKMVFFRRPLTGWRLKLAVQEMRTSAGVQLEGHGIQPDIVVPETDSEKAALERAVEAVTKQSGQGEPRAAAAK